MARVSHSLLFVPGDRPERFDKAVASGAHAVILDLEDAVAPAAKRQAREAVARWLADGRPALVRINAFGTDEFDEDLRMVQAAPGAGVMLPKADVASLEHVAHAVPGRRLIALLETVAGYAALDKLAAVAGVERIAFGSVDFSTESGIADEGEAFTGVRTAIVLASRHRGLSAPIDGVGLDFVDESVMKAEALRSKQLGFGGKLCIHPRQAVAANDAFRPSSADVEWARRVLAAFEASAGAATSLDGRMVDKPVVDRARRLVEAGALPGPH